MIALLKKASDKMLGRGDYSVSIPAMDGALQTNSVIEKSDCIGRGETIDNLVSCAGNVYFSDAKQLMKVGAKKPSPVGKPFAAEIIATASTEQSIAVVTADGNVFVGKPSKLKQIEVPAGSNIEHTTAVDFFGENSLILCIGSVKNHPQNWTRDLLEKNRLGLVCSLDIATGKISIWADKLAYPAGVIVRNSRVIISEAWRHRLIEVSPMGIGNVVLSQLPGYPGRIKNDVSNGAILSVFAPRSQLIELVLREPTYRKRMMQEVPQHLWIAPAYSSGKSFLEPMQSGAVKIMGVLKPWAPSRSYGLVAMLDDNFQPISSYHSRADGNRHGITSAIKVGKNLILSSRGAGEVLKIDLTNKGAQS